MTKLLYIPSGKYAVWASEKYCSFGLSKGETDESLRFTNIWELSFAGNTWKEPKITLEEYIRIYMMSTTIIEDYVKESAEIPLDTAILRSEFEIIYD